MPLDDLPDLSAYAVKKPKIEGDPTVAQVVDDELARLGWSDNARLSALGDIGRENSWNRNIIFKGHSDPANNEYNRGIISWQKDRVQKLDKYLKANKLYGRNDDEELRGMVRFMDEEMRSNDEWKDIHQKMRDPNISTFDASENLRKYIKYVPGGKYNSYDPKFRVKNNARWAEQAQSLGLGRLPDLSEFGGNELPDLTEFAELPDLTQFATSEQPVTEKPETIDAQTPVPEKIETLDAQFAVAKDPANKARTSVFFPNDGTNRALQYADKLDAKQWGLFPDKKHNGLHLINLVKAKKLKLRTPKEIQDFIDKNPNALKTLGIVVEDVGNNTQGTAVVAKDADGNELAAGVVTNPASAVEQAKNYKDQFPNAQIEVTNTDDVVKARKDEVDLLAPTSPTGEADDPDEQGLLQARFESERRADPTLTVERFNNKLKLEHEELIAKSKQEWLLKNPAFAKFALDNKLDPFDQKSIEAYNANQRSLKGQRVTKPAGQKAGQQGQPPKENVDVAIKDIDEQPSEPQKFETSRVQTKDEPNVLFKIVTVPTNPYKGDRRAIARTALKQIAPEIGLSDAQIEQELDRVQNVGYYTADEKNGEVNIAFTQGDVERIAGKKFADTDLATKKAQQRIEAPGVTMPEIQQPSGTVLQQIRGMTRSEIEGENLMWKYRFDPLYREALNNVADVGGTAKDVDDEYARLMSNENLTRQEAIEFGREKGRQYSDDTLGSLESGFVGEGGKAVSYPAAIMRAANGLIPGLNDVGGRKLQNWLTNTSLAMQAAGQVEAEKNPGVVSSVLRLTGSAPGFMSRFAVSALLPGGARLTFAKDAAITSFGEGNDLGQVFKDAGKGAVMDILFGAGSKFGDAVRKGTLNKLLPKSVIDAIESGALETAYKGTDEAKKAFINAARRSLVADVLGTSARIGVIGGGTYTLAAAEGSQHPGMDTAMMLAFGLVTHAKKIGKMAKLSTQVWRIPGKTPEAKPREIMFLTEGGDKIAVYDVTGKFPSEVVEGVLSKDVDRSAFTAREMPGQTAILLPEQMPENAVEPKQPSGGKSDFIPTFTDQEKSEVLGSVQPTSKSREVQESKQTVEPKVAEETPVEVKEAPRFKEGKREKVEKIDKQKYDTLDFEDEIPSQPAQVETKPLVQDQPTVSDNPALANVEATAKALDNKINITREKGGFVGDFLNDYELIGEGSEHTVYRSKDGSHVIRISEPYNDKSESTLNARINDAMLISEIIGDGSLEVIGYYESQNGTKNPIYRQKFQEGTPISEQEAVSYLQSIGAIEYGDKYNRGYLINHNGKWYKISDLTDNFFRNKDGEINAIDAAIQEISQKEISEAYHKAKKDGSNPELVKVVDLASLYPKPKPVDTELNKKEIREKVELNKAWQGLRKTPDIKVLAKWVVDNSQIGDEIRHPDGSKYVITQRKTLKNGKQEIVLENFDEKGNAVNGNIQIITVKPDGSITTSLNGSIIANSYTDSNGKRGEEVTTYVRPNGQTKENIEIPSQPASLETKPLVQDQPTEVPVEGKTEVNQSKALRELGYTLPMQKKLSEAEKQEIVDKGIRRQDAEKKVGKTFIQENIDSPTLAQDVVKEFGGTLPSARQKIKAVKGETTKPRTVTVNDKQVTLTPEQEARWVKEVEEPLAKAKAQRDSDLKAAPRQRQAIEAEYKGKAMAISAIKREITGQLTGLEAKAKAKHEASNYIGKEVSVDGQNGKVIGNPFGRVKIEFADGTIKTVDRDKITAPITNPVKQDPIAELKRERVEAKAETQEEIDDQFIAGHKRERQRLMRRQQQANDAYAKNPNAETYRKLEEADKALKAFNATKWIGNETDFVTKPQPVESKEKVNAITYKVGDTVTTPNGKVKGTVESVKGDTLGVAWENAPVEGDITETTADKVKPVGESESPSTTESASLTTGTKVTYLGKEWTVTAEPNGKNVMLKDDAGNGKIAKIDKVTPVDQPMRQAITEDIYEQAKDDAGRIRGGSLEVRRLDSRGEQGRIKGGQRAVEASVLIGRDEAQRQEASQRGGSNVESRSDEPVEEPTVQTEATKDDALKRTPNKEDIKSFENAASIPARQLIQDVDFNKNARVVEDGVVAVDEIREVELIRRLINEANGTRGGAFYGVFNSKKLTRKFLDTLMKKIKSANEKGIDTKQLKTLKMLVTNASKQDGTVIFAMDEAALTHEKVHRALNRYQTGTSKIAPDVQDAITNSPIFKKVSEGKWGRAYAHANPANKVEEFITAASTLDWDALGIKSEADKRAAMSNVIDYYNSYAETNKGEGTAEEVLNALATEIAYVKEITNQDQKVQADEGTASEADGDSSIKDAERKEDRPDVKTEGKPDELKERKTVNTAHEYGLLNRKNTPEGTRYYTVKHNEPVERAAQEYVEQVGFDTAFAEAILAPTESNDIVHLSRQMAIIQLLDQQAQAARNAGNLDLYDYYEAQSQAVMKALSPEATEAGQFIQLLSRWKITNPATVRARVRMNRVRNGLSPNIDPTLDQKLTEAAEKLQQAQAIIDGYEARLRDTENKESYTVKGRKTKPLTRTEKTVLDRFVTAREEALKRLRQDAPMLMAIAYDPRNTSTPLAEDIEQDLVNVGVATLMEGWHGKPITRAEFDTQMTRLLGSQYSDHADSIYVKSVETMDNSLREQKQADQIARVRGEEGNELKTDDEIKPIIADRKAKQRDNSQVRAEHRRAVKKYKADSEYVEKVQELYPDITPEIMSGVLMRREGAISPAQMVKNLREEYPDQFSPQYGDTPDIRREKLRSLNHTIAEAEKAFKATNKALSDARKELRDAKLSPEQRRDLELAKRARSEGQKDLSTLVREAEVPKAGVLRALAQILRAMKTALVQTAVNNVGSAKVEQTIVNKPVDTMDILLQRVFKGLKNEGLTKDASIATAWWTPNIKKPVMDEGVKSFIKGFSKHEILLRVIDEHPEYFAKFFGDISPDLHSGVSKTLDRLMIPMRVQEFFMRDSEGVKALAQRAAMKGLDFKTILETGDYSAFDEADVEFALKRALDLTYASRPQHGEGLTASVFTGIASALRYSGFVDLIASEQAPFLNFMYNTINKYKSKIPVMAQMRLVGKTAAAAKRLKRAGEEPHYIKEALREQWTSRQIADQMWGVIALGVMMSAVRALGDSDDWYLFKIPFTQGLGRDGGYLYFDIRTQPMLSPIAFIANKFNRLMNGKDAFTYDNGVSELAEPFLGISYRGAIEGNQLNQAALNLAYYALDDIKSGKDVEKNWDKFIHHLSKWGGNTLGTATNFLQFKTMKDILAQFDKDEQVQLRLTDRPFVQGLDSRLPESKRLLRDVLKMQVTEDLNYATGARESRNQYPALKIFGLNLRDEADVRKEPSQATILAAKLAYKDRSYTPPVLPEDVTAADVKRDFRRAGEKTLKGSPEADSLLKKLQTFDGVLKKGQIKYASDKLLSSDLQDSFESLTYTEAERVFDVATDAEKSVLSEAYRKKLSNARKSNDKSRAEKDEAKALLKKYGWLKE